VNEKPLQINEVTETIANNLDDNEKQIIITKLQKQESEIKNGIADPESIIHVTAFSSEQEIFKRWANRLKQLHYLGVYQKPINTISSFILTQIGKMTLSSSREEDLDKKSLLKRNLHRSLTDEYKDPSKINDRGQNDSENTSGFCNIENSFMFRAIANFKSYHEIFAEIAGTLLEHLADRKINKEFTNCLEWEEISQFCSVLEAMQEKIRIAYTDVDEVTKKIKEFSALDYIKEDLNIRQSADSFRDAQYVLTGADKSFRNMAHKFGIVPRQCQRVRNRLEDWPKKDAKKIIQLVMGSYGCPCGCNIDLVTNKRMVDLTSDKFYWTIRYRDRKFTIPEKFRQKKDITPISIAEKVFAKKLTLVEIKK